MRRPSSPFNSVEPNPGRYIAAQSNVKMTKAVRRDMKDQHPTPNVQHPTSKLAFALLYWMLGVGCWMLGVPAASAADHVLLCVWDGMRPDFIKPDLTPNLHALAERGTFFANNHSFWVSTTEVNGTVLATGAFPVRSKIVANREYRPSINIIKPVQTEAAHTMRVGDALTDGHYLGATTIAELVQASGQRTVVAGTKGVALLHDRNPDSDGRHGSVTLFAGKTYPSSLLITLRSVLGRFPPYPEFEAVADYHPNTDQNLWTTRALTEVLWNEGVPRYTVLWLGDPDFSQHLTSPGDPIALASIHDSDTHFGMVVESLKSRGLLEKTDIFVVSDHGFSTVERVVDLVDILKKAGIPATREFKKTPAPGEVLIANVGGATSLYAIGKDPALIQKLVDIIQSNNFAGPIFTRAGLPGTFPLSLPHLDAEEAADIVFSFRWREGTNKHGTPGLIVGEGKRPGFGTHGTLSKYDVHNTFIAAGPDIRPGIRNETPTGNIDVAPTILHLLGLTDKAQCDGRILTEAFTNGTPPAERPITERIEAKRTLPNGKTWIQYLQLTKFGGKMYFDEGNAETK
jgi:arylsulfatase A-like enzyme